MQAMGLLRSWVPNLTLAFTLSVGLQPGCNQGGTGPMGNDGTVGPKGEKGEKGDRGDRGEKGDVGP